MSDPTADRICVAMCWEPIDTAPREGSEIIVCEAGTDNLDFVRWNDFTSEWLDRMGDPVSWATHWMPRPETTDEYT